MTAELEKQPADKMHKIVFEVSIDGAEKWQGALRNVENVHKSLGYFKENQPRVSLGICLRAGDHRRRFPGRLDRR